MRSQLDAEEVAELAIEVAEVSRGARGEVLDLL
jgi:hypothetical protein